MYFSFLLVLFASVLNLVYCTHCGGLYKFLIENLSNVSKFKYHGDISEAFQGIKKSTAEYVEELFKRTIYKDIKNEPELDSLDKLGVSFYCHFYVDQRGGKSSHSRLSVVSDGKKIWPAEEHQSQFDCYVFKDMGFPKQSEELQEPTLNAATEIIQFHLTKKLTEEPSGEYTHVGLFLTPHIYNLEIDGELQMMDEKSPVQYIQGAIVLQKLFVKKETCPSTIDAGLISSEVAPDNRESEAKAEASTISNKSNASTSSEVDPGIGKGSAGTFKQRLKSSRGPKALKA